MTTISAKVVEDSCHISGSHRITTLELRYPRCIHAEVMTHRVFSRNASSSRAIPVKRLIQDVLDDPFVPRYWGSNKPGMRAGEELDEDVLVWANREDWMDPRLVIHRAAYRRDDAWLKTMHLAVDAARGFAEAGYHKQIVNRLLEPFSHISVLVTSTEWDNFFTLRDHGAAEPHIRDLAREMRGALARSEPRSLGHGEWHLPYVKLHERIGHEDLSLPLKLSVARCARVSYLRHDGENPSLEDDVGLYDRLISERPPHASPLEHQATPDSKFPQFHTRHGEWASPQFHGNFVGWVQHRKVVERGLRLSPGDS